MLILLLVNWPIVHFPVHDFHRGHWYYLIWCLWADVQLTEECVLWLSCKWLLLLVRHRLNHVPGLNCFCLKANVSSLVDGVYHFDSCPLKTLKSLMQILIRCVQHRAAWVVVFSADFLFALLSAFETMLNGIFSFVRNLSKSVICCHQLFVWSPDILFSF